MIRRPKTVVIIGTKAIMSMEILEPMITKALKRKRSPREKPIRPESSSQNQFFAEASMGMNVPRVIQEKKPRKKKAKKSLIILTGREPTLLPAYSKDMAVTVQQTAVARAASSPSRDSSII